MPGHDVNERAEAAMLSAAEAYRLVEEAREQRERAEKAEAQLNRIRETAAVCTCGGHRPPCPLWPLLERVYG